MTEPKRGIDLSTAVIAGADGPAPVAERSLVKIVAEALTVEACGDHTRRTALKYWSKEARAAILAVADWLDCQWEVDNVEDVVEVLRREVDHD